MEPFLGQIMAVGFNFAPRGWAQCNGQLLSIAQNTALFSLLGTTFGGDGRTTFALPDYRGRTPVGMGTGPGLPNIDQGEAAGASTETLTIAQMPTHTHTIQATAHVQVSTSNPTSDEPKNGFLTATSENFYAVAGSADNNLGGVTAAATALTAGGSQPISLMQPFLGTNYIIALEGVFPSRS